MPNKLLTPEKCAHHVLFLIISSEMKSNCNVLSTIVSNQTANAAVKITNEKLIIKQDPHSQLENDEKPGAE